MNQSLTLSILLACIFFNSQAQENTVTAGNNVSNTAGSVSYSIGQVFYTSQQSFDQYQIQGVQQPLNVTIVTGQDNSKINLEGVVYPNPTTNNFILELTNSISEKIYFEIQEINGATISKGSIDNKVTQISFNGLVSGVYFLKVFDNNTLLKTFKISKN